MSVVAKFCHLASDGFVDIGLMVKRYNGKIRQDDWYANLPANLLIMFEPGVKVYVRRGGDDDWGGPKLRSTTMAIVNRTLSNFTESFSYMMTNHKNCKMQKDSHFLIFKVFRGTLTPNRRFSYCTLSITISLHHTLFVLICVKFFL